MFRSLVTGKPRDIWLFNTPAARGYAKGAITGDVKDQSIDIGDRVFANLLTPKRDAREAIFPTANGLLIFGLFDGNGKRQDEVPPDIANDYTIPKPHTQRLDIFGCITCHSIIGRDGWQPAVNDAKTLLSGHLDIFGDRSVRGRVQSDIIDRIAGKYTGDITRDLMQMRDHVAEATLKATGPWKGSEDQTDVCKLAAQRIFDEYDSYFWRAVDAQIALQEIGLDVPKDQAVRVFGQVVLPDLQATAFGVVLEDPRIAALSRGLAINRSDFALVYSIIAARARRNPVYVKLRSVR